MISINDFSLKATPHFGPFDLLIQREEIDGVEYTTFRPLLLNGEVLSPWCSKIPCEVEIVSHD